MKANNRFSWVEGEIEIVKDEPKKKEPSVEKTVAYLAKVTTDLYVRKCLKK